MPEIAADQLLKIILFLLLLICIVVLIVSFLHPTTFNILGAIPIALSNLIASILG